MYISLYVLSSINEIHQRIITTIYPFLGNELILGFGETGINYVLKKIGIDKQDIKSLRSYVGIPDNRVLFFDDLERIDTTKIDIQSVLGYINSYTEHKHLKVIIISNDEKLDDAYKNFKEKTIRFSVEYKNDISSIFDTLCRNFNRK